MLVTYLKIWSQKCPISVIPYHLIGSKAGVVTSDDKCYHKEMLRFYCMSANVLRKWDSGIFTHNVIWRLLLVWHPTVRYQPEWYSLSSLISRCGTREWSKPNERLIKSSLTGQTFERLYCFSRAYVTMLNALGKHSFGTPRHDDVIKWIRFPRYWTFVRGIHRSIPLTKASDAELWCFLWSAPEQTVE